MRQERGKKRGEDHMKGVEKREGRKGRVKHGIMQVRDMIVNH